jgi:hypothetical protein
MLRAILILLAAAPFAAGCEEEYEPPRTAVEQRAVPQHEWAYGHGAAVPPEVVEVQQPVPDRRSPQAQRSDPVWQTETYYVPPPSADYYVPPPTPIPRHTVSLGYIGDWPLWSGGDPPPAPWWRPFPRAWENDFHYGHAYGYGYGYGRRFYARRWR